MLTIYDFHIDFQFWTNLALPRDFQMALTHPWLFPDLGLSRMHPETQWMVFRDLYRYPHVYLSVLLVYQRFGAFYTHPNCTMDIIAFDFIFCSSTYVLRKMNAHCVKAVKLTRKNSFQINSGKDLPFAKDPKG